MALVNCKDCGTDVSTDAKTCPKCGARMKPKSNVWKWVLGLPLGGFVLLMVIGSFEMGSPEEQQARRTYKQCMKNLDSAPPGVRGTISGACDLLESQFRAKYGKSP